MNNVNILFFYLIFAKLCWCSASTQGSQLKKTKQNNPEMVTVL